MKQAILISILVLIMTAACADAGSPAETAQFPLAADPTALATVADQDIQLAANVTPVVTESQRIDDSANSVQSSPSAATDMLPGPAEPTDTPVSYPVLATTERSSPTVAARTTADPSLTATALPTAKPSPTGDPYPAELPSSTAEAIVPIDSENMAAGIDEAIPVFGYRIVNEFPHDRGSFTQGLVVDDRPGTLLEGSGLWGKSSLRRVDLQTGEVIQLINLPEKYFGEGITQFGDRIFQLTWKSGVGFIYDGDSFELLDQFNYAHEGWGITHDGKQLIVSDGTNIIYFWDPETLLETARIQVFDDQGPVTRLNELEFVNGEILAHVWQTDIIVRIDPQTGQVLGKIDLSGLLSDEDRDGTEDVLNGIAYDVGENRIFVTGKLWPKLFEIELLAPAASTDQKTDQ